MRREPAAYDGVQDRGADPVRGQLGGDEPQVLGAERVVADSSVTPDHRGQEASFGSFRGRRVRGVAGGFRPVNAPGPAVRPKRLSCDPLA